MPDRIQPAGAYVQDTLATQATSPTAATQLRRRSLSVVVPVLNEERGLDALVGRLLPVLEATGTSWEIVFVDDGSRNTTREKLIALNIREPRIKTVAFSRNFGKEIAVAAGLAYATGDGVILMDGDLQHPPEIIPEFVARWKEGYDIVYGQRSDRESDSVVRRIASRGFYNLFSG